MTDTTTEDPSVQEDAEREHDFDDQVSLGDAAAAGIAQFGDPAEGADQGTLDGMENLIKVRFVGMSYDSLENTVDLGEERTFTVRSRCVGTGDEAMNDGHVRHYVKMKVESVVLHEDD